MPSYKTDPFKSEILEIILKSRQRITPVVLEKIISQKFGLDKKESRFIFKALVSEGHLVYTYTYGCTFLEPSFNKPVRISKYVILAPYQQTYLPVKMEDVLVQLKHGVSFGTGSHPSTRLAIKGIEYALIKETDYLKNQKETSLLDIGTGSGVLAITGVKLGIKKGIGIDIDPCAVAEAKENVKINHLEDRIQISDLSVNSMDNRFSMVIANLRYPSLIQLYPQLLHLTDSGVVVFSGIKSDEVPDVLAVYTKKYFQCCWEQTEKDWAGLVLKSNRQNQIASTNRI